MKNPAVSIPPKFIQALVILLLGPCRGAVVGEPLVLVEDGRYWQTQAYAAEKLQNHLAKIGGATLPIVSVSKAPTEGTLLLVGRSALTEAFGIEPPAEPEGFVIKSFSRGLAIVGEVAPVGTNNWDQEVDRGTYHGVFTLLEHLGFGFYLPSWKDESYPPEVEDFHLVVPEGPSIHVAVPLELRDAPVYAHRNGIFAGQRPGRRYNFNIGHTHRGWWQRFGESHPEYFALRPDGTRSKEHLCYSEPDVVQRDLELTEETYAAVSPRGYGHPNEHYIPVAAEDHYNGCYCSRCLEKYDPKDRFSLAGLWFDYANRLAPEIEKKMAGSPDRHLCLPELSLAAGVRTCRKHQRSGVYRGPGHHGQGA